MAGLDRSRLDIGELGKILLKRRWTIAVFFLLVTTLVTVATILQKDVFRATATIQIEPAAPNIIGFKEIVALGAQGYWASKEYYETQFRIIRSRPILEKVIQTLHLAENPPFGGTGDPVRTLSNLIRVAPVKNSQLVNISVEFGDMPTAVAICNTLAETYRDQNLARKGVASQGALEWLQKELDAGKERLRKKEEELHRFVVENDIVYFENRQSIAADRVRDLSDAFTQTKNRRIVSQTVYNRALDYRNQGKSLAIPQVIENNLIQDLKAELVHLQKERSKAAEKWKPKHPNYQKIQHQIEELEKRINQEVDNLVDSLRADFLTDQAREAELASELDKAKAEAYKLAELEIPFNIKKREAAMEETVFEQIQKTMQETEITQSTPEITNNVRIIEAALNPNNPQPVSPRRRLNVMLGALLGLLGGIGLALLLEYLDTTIKSAMDLERTIKAPFLGIIPSFSTDEEAVPDELFTHRYPKSSITESVRSIRTNITFSTAGKEVKRLLVTSAGPQEGKSTAVINLGVIFAQSGKRVLIIDSDLRRPRLHRAFKVSRRVGLTNLIMGEKTLDEVILHTEVPGVDLVPCGPIPPNPSELLGTERMREISDQMADRYDLILYDSPPVVAVTDAVVMSKMVDGVVLIAKAGKTTREIMFKAQRQLLDVGSLLLGTVLNDFNIRGAGYRYYYYYYHYRSREGEGEGEEGGTPVVRKKVKRRRSSGGGSRSS